MKVISGAGQLPLKYKNVVTAIGVFDGVHLGHQEVIGRAVAEARGVNGTAVVVTFYPHPVAVLRPHEFKGYLMSLDHRLERIAALGVDVCYVIHFTRDFAHLTSVDFEKKFLIDKLRAQKVVVGEDFHFGSHRRGSADTFANLGLDLEKVPILKRGAFLIKSTLLKEAVMAGDLARLHSLLGRPFSMAAKVEKGARIGRRLGFPTANLKRENVIILPCGIYAIRARVAEKMYNGLFYIGRRPTISNSNGELSLEAHLLDFHGNLYGRRIVVEFLKRIRQDRKFSDEKELSLAIARDVSQAREYFQMAANP